MEKNRKCDSRCQEAKGKICKCWCDGRYHGLGSLKANELFSKDHPGNPEGEALIALKDKNVLFKVAKWIQLEIEFA